MTRNDAISHLLTAMADDALIQGHRNSEWTGLGPIMEEDIAFSSMAQDKIGHAWALYRILHENLEGTEPDRFAFLRGEKEYKCCHLVEMPNGEYDFSLMRHFLFDHAEAVRWEQLQQSTFEPLVPLARKLKGEIKYHTLHANAWISQLCRAAKDRGVVVAIGPDAHSTAGLDYTELGVGIARKGWLEPSDVLNTWGADAIVERARARRARA